MLPDFTYEKKYWTQGYTVIGIDEVGRGCIAGPLTLGAFVMKPCDEVQFESFIQLKINDSKKLSEKRRDLLFETLTVDTTCYKTVSIDVPHINEHGIMHAWKTAIVKLYAELRKDFPDEKFVLLVDGPQVKEIPCTDTVEMESIVKGDTKSIAIAAASIIAKVTRDRYMKRLATMHPEYLWDKNKGYGTAEHSTAVKAHGITPWHRTLFVRSILQ